MRSDNVDFRRGELECGAHNIYFDRFSYDLVLAEQPHSVHIEPRGSQFIGIHDFSSFAEHANGDSEVVVTSPVFTARTPCNELVASWNVDMPDDAYLKVEVRTLDAKEPTKFYNMGLWPNNPARHPHESILGQSDAHGDVHTDTLVQKRPAGKFQARVTLGGDRGKPRLKFIGLLLLDTGMSPAALPPDYSAWGTVPPVPERSQMVYPKGSVWCSPTTVSMLLAYWSQRLNRPDLNCNVPMVADRVYDAKWQGTGNRSFNMAFAGSCRGIRAYVTRMADLAELQQWIAAGIPVGLSVSYDRLRGKDSRGSGHLVVSAGFTPSGDAIINDPGTLENVRKVFPRKNLIDAWSCSHNTAYLIYPENWAIPKHRFGHWGSWLSGQQARFEK
jgi:hypothetical protein